MSPADAPIPRWADREFVLERRLKEARAELAVVRDGYRDAVDQLARTVAERDEAAARADRLDGQCLAQAGRLVATRTALAAARTALAAEQAARIASERRECERRLARSPWHRLRTWWGRL